MDLAAKAKKSVKWNTLETIITQFLRLTLGIVMARLLLPSDYGLVAMAAIFFTISQVLIDSGFGQAYIRKENAMPIDANTVFLVNITISFFFLVLFWFGAKPLADFFNEERLVNIIRVMSVLLIINAFNLIQLARIRRNLEYKKKTIITIASTIVSGVIGITMAYLNYSYWSLVIQQVSNRILVSVGLILTSNEQLKLNFSRSSFLEMYSFGSWLLLSNLMIKAFNNIYRFVIGKYYSAEVLGVFDKGQQFPTIIYEQLSWSVGSVSFTVYTKILNEKQKLKSTLLKFSKYTSIIIISILSVLYVTAESFVITLLTEKWLVILGVLKLSCILGAVVPAHSLFSQFIDANGYSKNNFLFIGFLNLLRVLNVLLNLNNGIEYLIAGEIVTRLLTLLLMSYVSRLWFGFNFLYEFIKSVSVHLVIVIVVSIIGTLCMSIVVNQWVKLMIVSFVMFALYAVLLRLFEKKMFSDLMSMAGISFVLR